MTEFRWIRAKKFSFPLGSGIHLKTHKMTQIYTNLMFNVNQWLHSGFQRKLQVNLNQSGQNRP